MICLIKRKIERSHLQVKPHQFSHNVFVYTCCSMYVCVCKYIMLSFFQSKLMEAIRYCNQSVNARDCVLCNLF
jgi:hypothetical protein